MYLATCIIHSGYGFVVIYNFSIRKLSGQVGSKNSDKMYSISEYKLIIPK